MKDLELHPYVTAKGGVVILNGPFPLVKAEKVRALCAAAPALLGAAEKAVAIMKRVNNCRRADCPVPFMADEIRGLEAAIAQAEVA